MVLSSVGWIYLTSSGTFVTPNPMNRKTFIRGEYSFGPQTSPCLGTVESAPALVQACVADAQRRAGKECGVLYTGAHVNWYNGKSALGPHQDVESATHRGHAIYSYSFLQGCSHRDAFRFFVVSHDRKQTQKVACIPTRKGSFPAGFLSWCTWHHS